MKRILTALILSVSLAVSALAGSTIGGNPSNPVVTNVDGFTTSPYMVGYKLDGKTLTITKHYGGRVINYSGYSEWEIMRKAYREGYKVLIDAPEGCWSACTIWLSFPEVSVTDRTKFHFHHPWSKWGKYKIKAGMGTYIGQMPKELRPWIRKNVTSIDEFVTLTGTQVKQMVPSIKGN